MLKLTNYDLNKNLMSCKEIKLYYSRKGVLIKMCTRIIELIDNLVIKSHHTSLRHLNDIRYYLQ